MKKLPDELMSYWVKKVPPKIDFIFSESFVKKNKFDKPNTDLPKPYGEHIVFSIEQTLSKQELIFFKKVCLSLVSKEINFLFCLAIILRSFFI